MSEFTPSDFESIKEAARKVEGKSAQERTAMFLELMKAEERRIALMSPEERARFEEIKRQEKAWPEPWWRNMRREALEEYRREHPIE